MLKKTALRRAVAALLLVLGSLVMFFAPETWPGAILLALGVSLEMIGIALRHRDTR